MQRRKITGAELKPSASQHVGMMNAEKCVRYLRGIGVEIDDATADSWLDAQGVYRFLRSEKASWRRGEAWSCRCGEMEGFREVGRGAMKPAKDEVEPKPVAPRRCESCKTGFVSMSTLFVVARDGSVSDYRSAANRVIPLRLDEWMGGI